MDGLFTSLGVWNWLIAGLVLLGLELVAPGMFLLWLGIAAIAVGLISFAIDWSWQAQVLAFAVLSIAMVPFWRRVAARERTEEGNAFLNRRAAELVGREFVLDKPIVAGVGTVRVDDTVWRVTGPDCAAGSRVRVVRAQGASLSVDRVSENPA